MSKVRIVSLDVEGTLVTPDFSNSVWHEGVPLLYAARHGLLFDEAKAAVERQYDEIGDQRSEWYDIKYWFRRFDIGDHLSFLHRYRCKVMYYHDVHEALDRLGQRFTLVVASGTARDFLPHLLSGVDTPIERVFSSISDYGTLKDATFYRTVCREVGAAPHEVAHIGDSRQFDFESAREAGLRAFHLDRPGKCSGNGSIRSLLELETCLDSGL